MDGSERGRRGRAREGEGVERKGRGGGEEEEGRERKKMRWRGRERREEEFISLKTFMTAEIPRNEGNIIQKKEPRWRLKNGEQG